MLSAAVSCCCGARYEYTRLDAALAALEEHILSCPVWLTAGDTC